jgi:hypothetical protein
MKFEAGQLLEMKKRSLLGEREFLYIILGQGENPGFSLVYCLKSPRDLDVGRTFSMNDYVLSANGKVIDAA